MESRAKNLFFALLRRALWGGEVCLDYDAVSREDLLAVVGMSKSQTVKGLISCELLEDEELSALFSEKDREVLTNWVMVNWLTSQKISQTLAKVAKELHGHRIRPVLLKGAGVAHYYLRPELRQCGDIDIYVAPESFLKACEVLDAMADVEGDKNDITALKKHYRAHIEKTHVELHRFTDIYFPKSLDKVYQKISDEGTSEGLVPMGFYGVEVMTPSTDFNVFFVFNHFWHHFILEGVGLRQICDWCILLHANRDKIDREHLGDMLDRMGLMKEWKVFGNIAVDALGLPKDEMPFYEPRYQRQAEKVLNIILSEGNFGVENFRRYRRPKAYYAGKLYSFRKRIQRSLRVFGIFPVQVVRQLACVAVGGVSTVFEEKFSKSGQ